MKFRIISFLLFLIFSHGSALAQKDYAIIKTDTVYGKIRNAMFGGIYLIGNNGTELKLEPKGVILYYRAKKNETYLRKLIPGQEKHVFMKRLISGKINVYTYTVNYNFYGGGSSSVTTWYADKNNDIFGEIKTTGLRGGKGDRMDFFRSLIADNDDVAKKFDASKKFSFDKIEELITEYNK